MMTGRKAAINGITEKKTQHQNQHQKTLFAALKFFGAGFGAGFSRPDTISGKRVGQKQHFFRPSRVTSLPLHISVRSCSDLLHLLSIKELSSHDGSRQTNTTIVRSLILIKILLTFI
jgi:hypothetical protein